MTTAQLKSLKKNKYKAVKVKADGITFASKMEYRRYLLLKDRLSKNEIENLTLQPVYLLQKGFSYEGRKIRAITYVPDFQYIEDGAVVVEEVKGLMAIHSAMKIKMFKFHYPNIKFILVRK